MVEIKADESLSGLAQAAQWRDAQRNPQPEQEETPEPRRVSPAVEQPALAVEVTPSEPQGLQTENLMTSMEPQFDDPKIVTNTLSADPHLAQVNRLIYGDVQIEDAMKRREEGTLSAMRVPHKPLPHIQELGDAAGENETVVGYFLAAQNSNRAMAALEERLGEARMENLYSAMELYNDSVDEPKGIFKAITDDLGIFAGEIPESGAAGIAAYSADLSNWFFPKKWLKGLNEGVHSVPALSEVAEFLDLTTVAVSVTPQTPEEITKLQQVLPNYSKNTKGLEQLVVGQETRLSLNPDELNAYNLAYGFENLEAHSETMALQEQAYMDKVDSATGQFAAIATEYSAAYIMSPGFSRGASFMGKAVNGLVKGAFADKVVYNEGDENVAAMLSTWGIPGHELLEFMATNPDDSEIMRQAKIIGEGALIGVAIETLGFGMMALKAARKGDLEAATKFMGKAHEAEATSNLLEATEFVDSLATLKADAKKVEAEINTATATEGATTVNRPVLEFDRDVLPDWTKANDRVFSALDVFVRKGTLSGADAPILKSILGRNWQGDFDIIEGSRVGNIYRIEADAMHEQVAEKILQTLNKIQEPTAMNTFRGMAYKVLDTLDEDMLDPHLVDRIKQADPAQWSTSDAANIFAAGMLQDTYVDQMQRLIADLATNADQIPAHQFEAKMQRINALQAQVGMLQMGVAKIGRNASHAFHALKQQKKVSAKLGQDQAHIKWLSSRNRISDRRKVEMLHAAFTNAANKRAKHKVANASATKSTNLEKLLHITNANLLFNTSTQALMLMGNAARATIRNPMVNLIEGLVVNPIEAALGRKDGWKEAGKSLQRAWHTYGMLAQALPDSLQAFGKFWRKGKSQFGESSMFDDKGYYTNKTLSEVRQTKADGVLDHGMKAAEHVYRFMGAVDEMFKELVITSEMGVRARTGDYGQELLRLSQKGKITNADFDKFLMKQGEEANFAVKSLDGRVMDKYARDVALDTMFQSEAAPGSLNQGLRNVLNRRNAGATLIRLMAMRFVTTPLNVMEERMATVLAPIIMLAPDNTLVKMAGGKFAQDLRAVDHLGAPDMRVRSRTRALLGTNLMFTTAGLLSAYGLLRGDGDDGLVDVDPGSRTFGQIRVRGSDGKKRYYNVMDLELPFINAFLMGRMAAEQVKHANDAEEAIGVIETATAISAMYMNQTLEKSSLANLTDSLAAVFDDKYRGMGQLMASNTTPYVPFNWWLTQFDDLTNEGEFNGKPNNIMERFGKTIRPLKLLGMGVLNKERDALGRLMPSTSRGFNPFVSREFKFDAISDEIGDIMETHGTEFKSPSFERSHIPFQEINAGDGRSIYDHMQESLANGEITIGGLTLEQAANTMISSDKYQDDYKAWQGLLGQRSWKDAKAAITLGGPDMQDPRIQHWRELLKEYRDKSLEHTLAKTDAATQERIKEFQLLTNWQPEEKREVQKLFK